MRAFVGLILLASAFTAGCVESEPKGAPAPLPDAADLPLQASNQSLWVNPQTFPHPAFNYPTLTNPATGSNVSKWWKPIEATTLPASIAGMDLLASTEADVPSGAGMSVFGSLAVVPGYFDDTYILDISDPAKPAVLSHIPEERHRNVDFIAYPTGRLVAVFSTDQGILPIWDLTDPANPERLGELKPETGTHKVNIVPGTPIVYNANSFGGGEGASAFVPQAQAVTGAAGQTEIFDLSNPEKPVLVQNWKNGYGCHHIYFWMSKEQSKYRAICAGIEATQLWDIKDPTKPEVLVTIPVHHGVPGTPTASVFLLAFSHFGILNYAGDVLIVGDEMGGGGFPPGCAARAGTPVRDVTTPAGALWFYDVKDEKNPRVLGWFSPGAPFVSNPPPVQDGVGGLFFSCTAHHGRLVPDPDGRELLAMAFYSAGVVLVDFTDPSSPRMLDQHFEGTNTWEVQYYNGYLFTGDLNRGMDVLKFV